MTVVPTLPDNGLPSPTATPTTQLPPAQGWIAFVKNGNIWLIHPDGSGAQQATFHPPLADSDSGYGTLRWSHDGNTLAYARGAQVYLLDPIAMRETMLVSGAQDGFDWSVTDKRIVYDTTFRYGSRIGETDNDGLWIARLDDRQAKQLVTTYPAEPVLWGPDLSVDDRYVLFWGRCGDIAGSCSLYLLNFETGAFQSFPISNISACDWSPIDLRIACTRNLLGKDVASEVIVTDVNANILASVPASSMIEHQTILWSPDAQTLAVGYYAGPSTDLISLADKERRFFANGLPLAWSPDGKWILIMETGIEVLPRLFIVNVETGLATFLTEMDGRHVAWQPNGSP